MFLTIKGLKAIKSVIIILFTVSVYNFQSKMHKQIRYYFSQFSFSPIKTNF